MEQKKSLFGPLFLIAAGVMWLLVKSGSVPAENLWALTHIWPYVLIAAGLGLILRNYWRYASIAVDVLILGGALLAIVFAPQLGWANASVLGQFNVDGDYFGPGEPGSGNVITQTREVANFDAVEVDFPARVFISQGQTESVKVEAEDNFLPDLKTEVRNGTLDIDYKPASGKRVNPTEPVVITIVVRDLTEVNFNSAGDLTIEEVQADNLDISMSGAGNLKLIEIVADNLTVNLSGAGNLTASGSVATLDVDISGFGNFDGGDLKSSDARITLSGAGNATVWAIESLDAEISGAGSVSYYGDAKVTRQISGLGGVKSLGDK
jgi:hypothetical protein